MRNFIFHYGNLSAEKSIEMLEIFVRFSLNIFHSTQFLLQIIKVFSSNFTHSSMNTYIFNHAGRGNLCTGISIITSCITIPAAHVFSTLDSISIFFCLKLKLLTKVSNFDRYVRCSIANVKFSGGRTL